MFDIKGLPNLSSAHFKRQNAIENYFVHTTILNMSFVRKYRRLTLENIQKLNLISVVLK